MSSRCSMKSDGSVAAAMSGRKATMQMKNSAPGSIASGPASSPAMTASRLLVRCLTTGRTTTAPIRL